MTKELVAQNGLDPDKDMAMIVTGDHNSSIQALKAGSVDGVVVSVPWQTVTTKAGFQKLAYFGDAVRMPMAGLGAAMKLLESTRSVSRGRLKQRFGGIDFLHEPKNKSEVLSLLAEWFKISPELANDAYQQMIEAYPASGLVSDEALEKDLEVARQTGAIKGRVPLSRLSISSSSMKRARNYREKHLTIL
jgi:ABC-type nitrate/sulfonate/bicarbonate transport system substrate-binding protein